MAREVWAGEHRAPHPLAHFCRRRVGERDRGDLWYAALAEEPNVAVDEDCRLPAARAGGDEDIVAAGVDDRLLLGGHSHRFDRLNVFTRQMCWKSQ